MEHEAGRCEFMRRRYAQDGVSRVQVLDGSAVPRFAFPDVHFDLVVVNGVLEGIPEAARDLRPREAPLRFLREVRRVLPVPSRRGRVPGRGDRAAHPACHAPEAVVPLDDARTVRTSDAATGARGDRPRRARRRRGPWLPDPRVLHRRARVVPGLDT